MQAASAGELLQGRVQQAGDQPVLKALMEVAYFPQFVFDPAGIHALFVLLEPGGGEIIFEQRGKCSFRGEHAALDSQMNALEPLRIQETGGVPNDHPAIAGQGRHGEPSAIRKCLCAVADHLAPAQQPRDQRMHFEILENALRIYARVLVVKTGNIAERNDVIFRSVQPTAAVFFGRKRPAHGVNHLTLFDRARRHFPQLFYADAIDLGIEAFLQVILANKLLRQRTAWALRQDGDLRLHVIARLEVRFLLAVLVHALIVGANANDLIAFHKKLCSGKAGEYGDAGLLNFFSQPLHEAVDGDHVVTVVLQGRRRQRQAELALFREKVNVFLGDLGIQRRFRAPAGKKLVHGAGIEQCAGKRMLAKFTRLLQDVDVLFAQGRVRIAAVVAIDQLRKTQRAGESGRAAANNGDVRFHLRTLDTFKGFAEIDHSISTQQKFI